MSSGFPKKVKMTIDEARYWEGLGRQEMDFQQVLGELVDNSISASGFDTDGDLNPFTIEITIQRIGNRIRLKVADQGIGMSINDLEEHVLSPGGKGATTGPLNEHGFGLKNALCVLSLGNRFPFRIQARDKKAIGQDHYYLVEGPFSSNMEIKLDDASNWNTNIAHATEKIGTRIYAETSYDYFSTLYRRGKHFEDNLIRRLAEHLGVMYRGFLGNPSNKMWLRWQDLGADDEHPNTSAEWKEYRIKQIPIPYDVNGSSEKKIEISGPEGTATALYIEGNLDKGMAKDGTQDWPYPLMIYYQANIPTQGIDISVRGRVIKTRQLPEIWPERQRHNDYNYFVGELLLDDKFKTVNNKIAVDPHSPYWQVLLDKLNTEERYSPTKRTQVQTEKDIKEKMKKVLEATVSGSVAYLDSPVWSGSGVEIDIYEVKAGTAEPIDVYQLLMYWDGIVVDQHKSPDLARLVAKDAPGSVTNMISELNKRKDAPGNDYKFEFKKVSEFGI
jgi:hypothetical protein